MHGHAAHERDVVGVGGGASLPVWKNMIILTEQFEREPRGAGRSRQLHIALGKTDKN